MEIRTFEMRELKAAPNMVLTNGETYSTVGGSVFLGVNDDEKNWYEITEAEALERQKAETPEELEVN